MNACQSMYMHMAALLCGSYNLRVSFGCKRHIRSSKLNSKTANKNNPIYVMIYVPDQCAPLSAAATVFAGPGGWQDSHYFPPPPSSQINNVFDGWMLVAKGELDMCACVHSQG